MSRAQLAGNRPSPTECCELGDPDWVLPHRSFAGWGLTVLATTDESALPLEVENLEAGRETALYAIT